MAKIKEILLPDIGDFSGVEVIEIFVSAGDEINKDDSLVTLESDKAAMEIPCPESGTVQEIAVKMGDKISQGDVLITLKPADENAAPAQEDNGEVAPAPAPTEALPVPAPSKPETPAALAEQSEIKQPPPPPTRVDDRSFSKAHASPAVRRMARELGVNLAQVEGSGRKGRIVKEDVQIFVKGELAKPRGAVPVMGSGSASLPEVPAVDFSKFGDIETKPLSRIKKISGAALHRNWVALPHVTQFDEADITELEAFRQELKGEAEKRQLKMTPLAFLIKASVTALKSFPDFNASLSPDKENLIFKKYFHIGFAADTPQGLVVPVIRNADQKGLFEVAEELMVLSAKAREGKLSPDEMQGGCFTISSLGGIGGTAFTPIINAPEVAILGVSRSKMQPVWKNDAFVPRLMLPLSLSYDHRVIDGAQGARFITYLSYLLSDVRRLLL